MADRAILVLEADEKTRSALQRGLSREPYVPLFASRMSEALTLLESHPVDVVIAGATLPEMTGQDFLREVRRRRPETMRILLAGQASLGSSVEAVLRGEIFRFLTEPWDDIELRGVVRGALERLRSERDNSYLLARVRGEIREAIDHVAPDQDSATNAKPARRTKTVGRMKRVKH
jgi:DNA-binding NtrC family response regulator